MSQERDAFISYASEDRHPFVSGLAWFLRDRGAKVWYDERELLPGQRLAEMDRGISVSKFGLAVISPAYPGKHWTMQELGGLRAREAVGKLTVVSILLGTDREFLVDNLPTLAGTKVVEVGGRSPLEVGFEILEIIRPDLSEYFQARAYFANSLKNRPVEHVAVDELEKGPVRTTNFSIHVHSRLRLLQASLEEVYNCEIEEWIDNLSRDLHPHKELLWWEFMAALYFKVRTAAGSSIEPRAIFDGLFRLIQLNDPTDVRSWGALLSPDRESQIADLIDQGRQMYGVMFSDAMFQQAADPDVDDQ